MLTDVKSIQVINLANAEDGAGIVAVVDKLRN